MYMTEINYYRSDFMLMLSSKSFASLIFNKT